MKICFIDEAGDLGAVEDPPRKNDQPVLVLCGLFVDAGRIEALTNDFLDLKLKFFPRLLNPSDTRLDHILKEIKGSNLRSYATRTCSSSKARKHTIGFLDQIFILLRRYDVRIVARIWIKDPGKPFNGTSVYTSSIQHICGYFENYLTTTESTGVCIADSRNIHKNSKVSHSIFTQKFGTANHYRSLIELPTFCHSCNHAGLQICDIVCSALLYPIACFAYCTGYVENVHVQSGSAHLRIRYGQKLQTLQHRFQNPEKKRFDGGIVISDAIEGRSGSEMFQQPNAIEY